MKPGLCGALVLLLSVLSVCSQRLVFSVVRRFCADFSVMEDDEEEFPSTRNEEFLHNNNGKEKGEKFAISSFQRRFRHLVMLITVFSGL